MKHPETDHGNGWRRISLENGPTVPLVALISSNWETIIDHTVSNGNCRDLTETVSMTREVTHSCTVGGSISVGGSVEFAAGQLFAKCAFEASANVTLNGQFSDSTTETIQISSSATVPPCKILKYKFEKLKKEAKGEIDTYDHKFVCRHIPTGRRSDKTLYCNPATLTGKALGWGPTRDSWSDNGNVPNCDCGPGIE